MGSMFKFAGQFLRRPTQIGAIAPSSRRLGRMITSWPRLERADVVVEFGPGTGAFTPHILGRLKPGAVFFALELDRVFYRALRRRFPGVPVYCDTVANVRAYLNMHGAASADCIVSGLPWAAFDSVHQDRLLQSTLAALSDGGQFVTFAYLPWLVLSAAAAFRANLLQRFSAVSTSRVVWWNLPPAIVYQCTK
jgi:phospholipid N-methyltransferase